MIISHIEPQFTLLRNKTKAKSEAIANPQPFTEPLDLYGYPVSSYPSTQVSKYPAIQVSKYSTIQ